MWVPTMFLRYVTIKLLSASHYYEFAIVHNIGSSCNNWTWLFLFYLGNAPLCRISHFYLWHTLYVGISDCEATGEFNSITGSVQQGRRRRRRSTEYAEYSFPEDRPLPGVEQNSIEHLLNTDSGHRIVNYTESPGTRGSQERHSNIDVVVLRHPRSKKSNTSTNATAIIKEKMHSMMDVMDTRIEGVEGIMSDLQRTVHKLNKKVGVFLF